MGGTACASEGRKARGGNPRSCAGLRRRGRPGLRRRHTVAGMSSRRDRGPPDRARRLSQPSLFDDLPEPLPAGLPEGLAYEAEFLSRDEEQSLVDLIRTLPLHAAKYKEYTARRRVA